jgi:hypothetical protein
MMIKQGAKWFAQILIVKFILIVYIVSMFMSINVESHFFLNFSSL